MAVYKKSAETRQRIIDATIHMVKEHGYANFSIKELSDYLDVPRSLVYYYYKNKEDIMQVLYRMRFADISAAADSVVVNEEDSLVRLILGYILFKRFLIMDPLFTEFILSYPTFASLGREALTKTIDEFYDDSKQAFTDYGIPTDDDRLREHVLTIDALSRALNQGVYNGALQFEPEEMMAYLCERTIMITFNLTRDEMKGKLDRAFALSYKIGDIDSSYIA